MAAGGSGRDDHIIGDAGFSFEVEGYDIFGFAVVEDSLDKMLDLIGMLLGLLAVKNGGSYNLTSFIAL